VICHIHSPSKVAKVQLENHCAQKVVDSLTALQMLNREPRKYIGGGSVQHATADWIDSCAGRQVKRGSFLHSVPLPERSRAPCSFTTTHICACLPRFHIVLSVVQPKWCGTTVDLFQCDECTGTHLLRRSSPPTTSRSSFRPF
jgi:hypothetical protein